MTKDIFCRGYKHVNDAVDHAMEMLLECNTVAGLKSHPDNDIHMEWDTVNNIVFMISGDDVIFPLSPFEYLINCEFPHSYKTEWQKMSYFLYCISCKIEELKDST